jgi:hypothetical protein
MHQFFCLLFCFCLIPLCKSWKRSRYIYGMHKSGEQVASITDHAGKEEGWKAFKQKSIIKTYRMRRMRARRFSLSAVSVRIEFEKWGKKRADQKNVHFSSKHCILIYHLRARIWSHRNFHMPWFISDQCEVRFFFSPTFKYFLFFAFWKCLL